MSRYTRRRYDEPPYLVFGALFAILVLLLLTALASYWMELHYSHPAPVCEEPSLNEVLEAEYQHEQRIQRHFRETGEYQ